MKIVRLDKNNSVLETLTGTYKDGVFRYKESTLGNLFGLFAEVKTKKINYSTSISDGKDKVVYTRFNGKSDEPLDFRELHETTKGGLTISDSSTSDFARDFKLVHLSNMSALSKPVTLGQIIEILFMVLLTINSILLYYDTGNLNTVSTNIMAPVVTSNSHQATLDTILLNQSQVNHQLLLRCINNQSV